MLDDVRAEAIEPVTEVDLAAPVDARTAKCLGFEAGEVAVTPCTYLGDERNQLEAQPAAASIALQHQRLQSIVDDWSAMTDEEKKRVLQMIFSEIGADHAVDGLKIEFRPRPVWEPYVEAVLARQRQAQDTPVPLTTSERKTGVKHAEVVTTRLVQDERGWLRLAG